MPDLKRRSLRSTQSTVVTVFVYPERAPLSTGWSSIEFVEHVRIS